MMGVNIYDFTVCYFSQLRTDACGSETSPTVVTAMYNLACFYGWIGEFKKAGEFAEKVTSYRMQEKGGMQSLQTAASFELLAHIIDAQVYTSIYDCSEGRAHALTYLSIALCVYAFFCSETLKLNSFFSLSFPSLSFSLSFTGDFPETTRRKSSESAPASPGNGRRD